MDEVLRIALLPSPEPGLADRPPEPEAISASRAAVLDGVADVDDGVPAEVGR
jgi:hypothetical protein